MRLTVRYDEIRYPEKRKGNCPVCGKSCTQQKTFTATQNPWNRNENGRARTRSEIWDRLKKKASKWKPDFTCKDCSE